jgi:calcineurin-like phosphoesterase family protein
VFPQGAEYLTPTRRPGWVQKTWGLPAARARIVVVGDLNGACNALEEILQGTGLMDARQRWIGGHSQLVQVGDLFNRGGGARRALALLTKLKTQALRSGGRVSVLLGNHEVMTALRHEAYCTEDEYLSFAGAAERRAWPARVERAALRLFRTHGPRGPILPLAPRLEAWKIEHVPGRSALRKALHARAPLGRVLRALPVAYQAHGCLFVHAGLLPEWAELGVAGLNARAQEEWSRASGFFRKLPKTSLFRSPCSPLWDRSLAAGGSKALADLNRSLELCGAQRMIVGHTQTDAVDGGCRGEILARFGGRLVLVDVGLGEEAGTPRAALVIEGDSGHEWTPNGSRLLWQGT